jgi:hypothetical protein
VNHFIKYSLPNKDLLFLLVIKKIATLLKDPTADISEKTTMMYFKLSLILKLKPKTSQNLLELKNVLEILPSLVIKEPQPTKTPALNTLVIQK